jgi:ribonuclease T2
LLGFDGGATASPEEIESEFLAANPWLNAETIAVTCRKQKLLDIGVCLGRDLLPRRWGANDDQKRLCPLSKIGVPPVEP